MAQTLPFANIIVVDDSSTDDTAAVASRFGVKCIRVDCRDASLARNAGYASIEPATYVTWLDADDMLAPDWHAKVVAAMKDKRCGFIYPSLKRFDSLTANEIEPVHVKPFDREKLFSGELFVSSTSLWRREAVEQAGLWRSNKMPDGSCGFTDYILACRIAAHGWVGKFEPSAVVHYRRHGQSMTAGNRANRAEVWASAIRQTHRLCIITLFAGRAFALDRYAAWLSRVKWSRELMDVVAVDNSCSDEFNARIDAALKTWGGSYKIVRVSTKATLNDSATFANRADLRYRNSYALTKQVAMLYSVARQHVSTGANLVWTMEDDIEPPDCAESALAAALVKSPYSMVTACAKSRFLKAWMLWKGGKRVAPDGMRVEKIDRTGFYCAMFKKAAWDSLAFRPVQEFGATEGTYDWAACDDLAASGGIAAHYGVRVKHWQEDGTFVG